MGVEAGIYCRATLSYSIPHPPHRNTTQITPSVHHYFLERIPYIIEKDVSKGYSKSYDVEVIVPFWDNSGMLISITKYFNPLLLVCLQETHVDNST